MLLEGIVVNGAIVLKGDEKLPDGTRVEVVVTASEPMLKPTLHSLLEMAGTLNDLPSDFAAQHDHYIHGTPKRN